MPKAKTNVKVQAKEGNKAVGSDFDYLTVTQKINASNSQIIPEKTQPLKIPEAKHRLGIFHRNGKKPELSRVLIWTKKPYGFKETTMEKGILDAAKLVPAKDDKGEIYIVIKKETEEGQAEYLPWGGGVSFPKVTSEKLGEALNWPEIRSIDKTKTAGWVNLNNMAVWLIVGVTLIIIFMIAYFGLIGGN